MKQLPDILAEVNALATIPEDQFEAALQICVADIQALVNAGAGTDAPAAPTVASVAVAVTFTDGSIQNATAITEPAA